MWGKAKTSQVRQRGFKAVIRLIKKKGTDIQLVPQDNQRTLLAERAIQYFKAHFISGLCGTDKIFPKNAWDLLLPQATITLNLMRPARANPKCSAYNYLKGIYDFNKNPMAPPGTKVIMHDK